MYVKMKKVSIIVPVYNCEKYIERCIQSLQKQSYDNTEIIIIDDGSKDNTYTLCQQYKSLHNLKLFHTSNQGVSHARNYGLANASGEYILFVDADDYVKSDYCERLVREIEEKDADLVICGFAQYRYTGLRDVAPHGGVYDINEFLESYLTTEFINMPWGKIYRKDHIKTLFNECRDMGEDFEFNMEYLSYCNRIACINAALYIYNIENETSLTKKVEKMGTSIYSDINVAIKNPKITGEMLKRFVLRRLKNYLAMINESAENQIEYCRLASVVCNDLNLRNLVKKLDIRDIRIYLLFNNHLNALRMVQKLIAIVVHILNT